MNSSSVPRRRPRFCRCLPVLLLIFLAPLSWPVFAAEPGKFMALGTGATNGVFYPVGEGICGMVNERRLEHGFRCLAYQTGAAVYNLKAIGTGELDLGISYANLLQDAYTGGGVFADDAPMSDLRLVTSLYRMPAVIIVKGEQRVDGLDQLTGLRINAGNVGSGKRTIADAIFNVMGWRTSDFSKVSELDTTEVEEAFCRGEMDVMVEAMAMDSSFIKRVTGECHGKFVNIPDEIIRKVIGFSPGLDATIIAGGQYPQNPDNVQTLSINAVLATSDRVSPEAIYAVTDGIFSKFDEYRAMHPALSGENQQQMLDTSAGFPLHEGTMRYCREHRLPCR